MSRGLNGASPATGRTQEAASSQTGWPEAGFRSGIVVGLARWGIEVAAEVTARLGLRLDALC